MRPRSLISENLENARCDPMEGVFDLSVNFSLYNGAVVLETSRSSVKIGLRDVTDEN